MTLVIKSFDELTSKELYEILRARAKVFVNEKRMTCIDPDGRDHLTTHVMLTSDDALLAYLRCERIDDYIKIGRVLTLTHGAGHGRILLEWALPKLLELYSVRKAVVHSQTDAEGFYSALGFVRTSDVYVEENVPHVTMEKC